QLSLVPVFMVPNGLPVSLSQQMIVWSQEHEIKCRPSAETATLRTLSWWPSQTCHRIARAFKREPPSALQIRTEFSPLGPPEQDAIFPPPGVIDKACTWSR